MEGTSGAPPTSRAISWLRCQIPGADPRLLRATELSTAKPEWRVPRLDTCAPLPNLPNRSLGPQSPLGAPLPAAVPRGAPPPPPRTNSPAGSDACLPFLLLVSCHCRWGPVRLRAPELRGRRGLQPLLSLALAHSSRPTPVRKALGARRSRASARSGGSCGRQAWCGGGGWRKVTGRNLHQEAGSGKEWKDAVKRKKKKKKNGGRGAASRG